MSTRFGENDFGPIEFDGRLVHPLLRTAVEPGDTIVVTWLSSNNAERTQGLSLRIRDPETKGSKGFAGLMQRGDLEGPWFALWSDQETGPVELAVREVRAGGELRVSNFWRMPDGRIDEWFNDYGILVEEEGPRSFVLRCNDGFSKPLDFDDQVVRIAITPAG